MAGSVGRWVRYYLCGRWEDDPPEPSRWWRVYDLPLGPPVSNATLSADGVWRRRFASGTEATFDTRTNTGRVAWAGRSQIRRGGNG